MSGLAKCPSSQYAVVGAIVGCMVLRFAVLGVLTFPIGGSRPVFRKNAQWIGVAVAVLSIANTDLPSGIWRALIHLVGGLAVSRQEQLVQEVQRTGPG